MKFQVGSLFIVGGMDASTKGPTSVDKFCLRTNSWSSPTASMTGRRLQFGVAVVDNKIYVVGGRDGLKTLSTVLFSIMGVESQSLNCRHSDICRLNAGIRGPKRGTRCLLWQRTDMVFYLWVSL